VVKEERGKIRSEGTSFKHHPQALFKIPWTLKFVLEGEVKAGGFWGEKTFGREEVEAKRIEKKKLGRLTNEAGVNPREELQGKENFVGKTR